MVIISTWEAHEYKIKVDSISNVLTAKLDW
jgi:hypothetical protein